MKQASPVLYAGVDRGERRRIARELAGLRERRGRAIEDARRLTRTGRSVAFLRPLDMTSSLAQEIVSKASLLPLRLAACSECHRPTPQCTCGFDWGNAL